MKTTITAPEGLPYVDMEREFDAPAELVHRAYREPELVKQWLGPRQYEMVIEKWDAREGGEYRYVHRDGSNAYAFRGVFHSMAADNMVQTFEFAGAPGHVSLDTQVIEDLPGGRSRVKSHSIFMSVADRDAMVESGMSEGVEDGYNRLDELLPTLQPVGAAG
ncbi:MAG TPA: SRPBCC family protein [Candidatus Limnocylindrales bacterium]|nr:SRPBCC family protein [Candidatus Limnocylindrales bacterium]